MTILVGILCDLGAVIAADKQASHGAFGSMTVGQPVTKVKIIKDDTLFASSGAVGLGQQFSAIIEGEHGQFKNRKYHAANQIMQKKIREILDPAFATAKHAAGIIGQAAQTSAICGSLLATEFQDGLKLVEIDPQGGFEFLSTDIPFVCLGSGKQNADPFLRYMWSILFDGKIPSIQDGVLAAYWTIQAVIELRSLGVGIGIDVFTLTSTNVNGKNKFIAKKLTELDLQEHIEFIGSVKNAMQGVRDQIKGEGKSLITPPPVMS